MSAFTTDTLDDAVLAGYSFQPVIDALNAGDDAEAGRQLRNVLELRAADDDARSLRPDTDAAFRAMFGDPVGELSALLPRLAVVPVLEVKP